MKALRGQKDMSQVTCQQKAELRVKPTWSGSSLSKGGAACLHTGGADGISERTREKGRGSQKDKGAGEGISEKKMGMQRPRAQSKAAGCQWARRQCGRSMDRE